jgi:hypothetical protein
LVKAAATATADGDRPYSEFSSYTYPLPSDGATAIATCTSPENACCLHGFEGATMVQGKGEHRIMVQIGCRCPMHTYRIYSSPTYVRGFKADEGDEVPLKWQKQLMVVRAEGLAGGSSGGGHKCKGKGKMPAAADDGVSSSDEDAAWELEDKEQVEQACQASLLLAAGSTGSSGGSGSGPAPSSGGGSSSTARPRSSRSSCTPINYSDDTRVVGGIKQWWLFCLSVRVWAWVPVGGWIGSSG